MEAANRAPDTIDSGPPDSSGRRSQRTLLPGTVLENRYEIQRVAGRGGMSTVYVSRDLRFGQVERLCAIKEMFDVDPDARVRALRLVNFERESALLATLSHPSIPKIYDYFSFNGLVYLVLEYIDGYDLERLLSARKAPFSDDDVIDLGLQICDVLQMLHGQKPDPIIFRDLKPSNIMLRQTGQVVLIDFGIARTIQGRQRGTMIGTEGYAPPEQYRGIADARGDIYALGATLHHLATNSDPRLETPFTFHERPVRSLNEGISDELSGIIMKMLSYNPADRYQNVGDLRADLEAVRRRRQGPPPASSFEPAAPEPAADAAGERHVAGTTVLATPPPAIERRPAARKRAARRRRNDTELLTERLAWATQTGDEVRGSAAYDGQSFVIGSYDSQLYSLGIADGQVRWRFRTGRGVVSRPAVDGERLIFGSEDHNVYAVDRARGTMLWLQRTGMPVRSSAAVTDSAAFIGSDDGMLYCLDLENGAVLWRQRTWGPVRSSPVVAGGRVFVGGDDTYLYSVDCQTGRVDWRSPSGGAIQSQPYVLEDRILVTSRAGTVTAFSRHNGTRLWQMDARAPILASPRVVNGIAVVGCADGALRGVSVDDGSTRWTVQLANQITSTALLAEHYGYIGTVDGDLVCFNTGSGEVIWRYHLGGSIVSMPVYGKGVIAVGSTDGRICGLTLTDLETHVLEKGG